MLKRSQPFIIHGPGFVAALFGTLLLSRLLSLCIPSEFYFTFQSLFSDRSPQNLMWSLVGKMIAPASVGTGIGWYAYRSDRTRTVSPAGFRRRLRRQWVPTLFAGCFLAAFLSAWPIITYWDLLANPAVLHLEYLFFVLYVLYMLAYGYMAVLGGLGMIYLLEHAEAPEGQALAISRMELSRVGALWLLNSGLASAMSKLLTQ